MREVVHFIFTDDAEFVANLIEFGDDFFHDIAFFSEGHEGGLEAIDHDAFDFVRLEMEHGTGEFVLVGNRRVGDESIIGIERDAKPEVHIELEWMILDGLDGPSLNVTLQADFERDSVIVDVIEEVAVFAKPSAMSDTMRIALMDGLMNGFRSKSLASMRG